MLSQNRKQSSAASRKSEWAQMQELKVWKKKKKENY